MMEGSIRRHIFMWLKKLPDSDWEISPPGSIPGKHDITGCWRGRYVSIEVKTPTGRLSRLQKYKIEKLEKAGAIVGVARSVEDAQEILAKGVGVPVTELLNLRGRL